MLRRQRLSTDEGFRESLITDLNVACLDDKGSIDAVAVAAAAAAERRRCVQGILLVTFQKSDAVLTSQIGAV